MTSLQLRKSPSLLAASVLAAVTVSADIDSAVAATVRHTHHAHSAGYYSRAYRAQPVRSATLPYRPEYGFLRSIPPNAIRGPGYTFVPGVGILGESCDLPTSACSNEYRDVR
jgi:hypothetical protein